MEDRQPTGLWLELLRGSDPHQRAAALTGAGLRTSLFAADPYPGNLPQRLGDCNFLVVGETYAADVSSAYGRVPDPDPATAVVPLCRYPRPSQGVCTGELTTGLLLVFITPRRSDQAQVLRDWGDFVHLRWIAAAAVPGYRTITPYEHVEAHAGTMVGGRPNVSPRYCHFYEMATDNPRATYETMTPRVAELLGGGPGTPAFDTWATHPALRIDYVNTFTRVGT